jgi:hypothetical protein
MMTTETTMFSAPTPITKLLDRFDSLRVPSTILVAPLTKTDRASNMIIEYLEGR